MNLKPTFTVQMKDQTLNFDSVEKDISRDMLIKANELVKDFRRTYNKIVYSKVQYRTGRLGKYALDISVVLRNNMLDISVKMNESMVPYASNFLEMEGTGVRDKTIHGHPYLLIPITGKTISSKANESLSGTARAGKIKVEKITISAKRRTNVAEMFFNEFSILAETELRSTIQSSFVKGMMR